MTTLLPPPAVHPLLAAHRHFAELGLGEWAMVLVAGLVSAWAIWRSVGYALHPGETEPDHIKRLILEDDNAPPAPRVPPPAASSSPADTSSPADSVSAPR